MRNQMVLVLAITLLMYLVVGFDIPVLRQIVSFIYLLFIPGFVLLSILKLKELDSVDALLLSIGLSITLLMFIGFLMNVLYPVFGFLTPLSTLPIVLTLSIITLIMSIVSYYVNNESSSLRISNIKFLPKTVFLICIPILSFCGAWFNNSHILLLMVAIIALLTLATILFKDFIPTQLYPLLIIVIAVSLLFHMSLISEFLTGWDIFPEYYVFQLTKSNSYWNPNILFNDLQLSNYNSMLSITILPTMLSSLLNITEEMVFKIVYALIYSLVPLTLYRTWKLFIGKPAAFLSIFFFMFSPKFYDNFGMRQIIAELFLALLLFLIVNKNIQSRKRGILLVIFAAALVVSHYSTSYIFLFTISFAWFFSFISKNARVNRRMISSGFVLLFFVTTFSWYTFISSAPSDALGDFMKNIWNSFSIELFSSTSRGATLYEFTNPLLAPSLLHLIDNIFAKILYFFIIIGFLGLFVRKIKSKEMRFDFEYTAMMTANAAILFAVIIIPQFGPGLNTNRFFHLSLFLLAPLCVLGGKTFFKWIKKIIFAFSAKNKPLTKNKALSLVCVVLVIIFLFKIGFLFEVTGDVPISPSLSKTRMQMSNNIEIKTIYYDFYIPKQDVSSAIWMSKTIAEDSQIYADDISKLKVLLGYGMISTDRIHSLNNNTNVDANTYIYLRYENVIDGQLRTTNYQLERTETIDINNISFLLNDANKIYSNGFSEVYQNYK